MIDVVQAAEQIVRDSYTILNGVESVTITYANGRETTHQVSRCMIVRLEEDA